MITVSLCMIVRDEEETLGRCLQSVAGVADEIVIADTGSVDRTKEIASRFTQHVLDFHWVDDFAAARNFSFGHATGDYILWLDADDVLLPEDRAKLLALKQTLDPSVDAVVMGYHTAFDASGNPIASTRRMRMVKRTTGFTWAGVVHEDLTIGRQYHYFDSDIVVTHRKPPSDAGPSHRNRRIFERMIAEGREMRPIDVLNYARELEFTKEFAAAIPYYERFLESGHDDVNMKVFALHKLATCYFMNGQPDQEWQCTLRSMELDAPRPEFACRIGERFVARNEFGPAIFWYETALADPAAALGRTATVENHAFKTWLPHKQLGLCYFQVGDYVNSLRHNRMAQKYLPDDDGVTANIAMLEQLIGERGLTSG